MAQDVLDKLTVTTVRAAGRERRNLVAWEHGNDRATLQANIPFIPRGQIIVHRSTEHLADGLTIQRGFDKGGNHGVDHGCL